MKNKLILFFSLAFLYSNFANAQFGVGAQLSGNYLLNDGQLLSGGGIGLTFRPKSKKDIPHFPVFCLDANYYRLGKFHSTTFGYALSATTVPYQTIFDIDQEFSLFHLTFGLREYFYGNYASSEKINAYAQFNFGPFITYSKYVVNGGVIPAEYGVHQNFDNGLKVTKGLLVNFGAGIEKGFGNLFLFAEVYYNQYLSDLSRLYTSKNSLIGNIGFKYILH